MIEANAREMRLGRRTHASFRQDVVFEPPPDSKKCQIVSVLHPQSEIAEDAQSTLGIVPVPKLPTKIEKPIRFVPGHPLRRTEEFVNDIQGASPTAIVNLAARE